ncbi:MAG: beta-ketoacyl synthase N-terminal-like domain-containing protein [Polyangiaceae bacterium]
MTPRAITGLGIVSAIGIGREAFLEGLLDGTPLANRDRNKMESFDATRFENPPIAEVPEFDAAKYLGDKGLRTLDRLTKLMVVAARLALSDARLKQDGQFVKTTGNRIGIVSSNAYGSLEAITELDRVATLEDARYINPAKFPNTVSNSASGYVSIWEDLRALNVAVSDGNCGGIDTFACADVFLEASRADALLVGGGESMSEALFLAFQKLGALGKQTILSEGAAFFSLESMPFARERDANIMAEVIGYGTAFIPPEDESLLIHASAEAMEAAIRAALVDANCDASAVDGVVSSLSGLRVFDTKEMGALRNVFAEDVAIASPKSVLGESLGAGGSMGVATGVLWLAGHRPHTMTREGARDRAPNIIVVTSLGYYGNASALVLRRHAKGEAN